MLASLRIACALLGEDKRCLKGGTRGGWGENEKWRGRKVEREGESEERNRRKEERKERKNKIQTRWVRHIHILTPTHPHTTPSHLHTLTYIPMNILHMNSAMINGCMLLHALRPRIAVIVSNPLICPASW